MKTLFRSNGGLMHKWFVRWMRFSVVNFFLFYWVTDYFIVTGTMDTASNAKKTDWYSFATLAGMQFFTIWLSSNF